MRTFWRFGFERRGVRAAVAAWLVVAVLVGAGGVSATIAAPVAAADGQLPVEFTVRDQGTWRWASLSVDEPPEDLVRFIDASFADVREALDRTGPTKPLIVACSDRRWFERVTVSLGGAKPHEWAAALAFPGRGVIVLDLQRRAMTAPHEFRITVAHEIVHVVIGVGLGPIPRWYHEGVAQYFSGDHLDSEAGDVIAGWAAQEEILPLSKLDRFLNRSHMRASIFYRQSFSFIRFVTERRGESIHGKMIRSVEKGASFAQAFERATGVELTEEEARWHQWLAAQFSWFRWFVGLLQPFSVVALICAAGFGYQKWRRRRQLRRMEEDEEPLDSGEEYWQQQPPSA
ncbi:MAG: hypothetical protein AAF488_00615 [Planctomycetota bacterium]